MKNNQKCSKESKEVLFDFKKIWAIIWKNWLVMKSDYARLVPMLLFPVIMITIFGFATTGSPKDIPTALVDYDNSKESMELITALRSLNTISIRHEVGTESEAMKLMDREVIKAVIIIPEGFGKALNTGESQARVIVKVDESDSTVAQIIKGLLQQVVSQYSRQKALARLAEIQAKNTALSQSINQVGKGITSSSESLSQNAFSKQELMLLHKIKNLLEEDYKLVNAQSIALKNKMGIVQSTDSYIMETLEYYSKGTGTTAINPPAYLQYLPQLKILEAQKATDKAALSIIEGLLLENQAEEKMLEASSKSLLQAGESIKESAERIQENYLKGEVIIEPIAYVESPAYGEGRKNIDFLLPAIIAMVIFQGATMGMGRAIAGEKKDGSLTRVFLTPTSNVTIITGTMLFYVIFESIRSSFLVFSAMLLFGVVLKGSILLTLFIIALFSFGATALGLIISAATKSQEQYLAVSMLVSLPSIFLSGVFLPVQNMPLVLQGIAGILPITYAATALRGVMIKGFDLAIIMPQVIILTAFAIAFTGMSLLVFKREIA